MSDARRGPIFAAGARFGWLSFVRKRLAFWEEGWKEEEKKKKEEEERYGQKIHWLTRPLPRIIRLLAFGGKAGPIGRRRVSAVVP